MQRTGGVAPGAPDDGGAAPRVVLLSQRSASRKVWQASQYEFEDVIAAVDDVRLVAPPTRDTSALHTLARSGRNRVRPRLGLAPVSGLRKTTITEPADLFFGVFANAADLGHLPRLRGLHERCTTKIAFVVELYTTEVRMFRPYLELLRGFDHVFVFSRGVLDAVREITGAPTSYLSAATDALRFAPRHPAPDRVVDVHSYGRRVEGTHEALLAAQEAGELFYLFPTLDVGKVTGYREHRVELASVLQRSRYTVVYKNNDSAFRARRTGGEETLTNRYFEAVAAGSVVLGSIPAVPDFTAAFDWPDAVVEIGAPAPDVLRTIRELDADPQRLRRARTTGVAQSLRRHDWAHRWRSVLEVAGLPPLPALEQRLTALEAAARSAEAAPSR